MESTATAPPVYTPMVRDMPQDERPREKLRARGPESLTNAELVAILLRTGTSGENVVRLAERILFKFEGVRGLSRATFGELAKERAMGEAKAAQLLAAMELGKRLLAEYPQQRIVRSAEDVYAMLFAEMALLDQEELRVILLTTRHEVICERKVYRGNVSSAIVRVSEVFRDAVREGCPAIIAVHNHPSGDPQPSAEDAALTKQLLEAGRLLGIELLDHVVIARKGFVSCKEKKIGFV
jgi:DNA repair protein RadC